ncbi:MAG: aspartate/glutamate racemase family protein [Acidobacteriaceae bacterium]|nr:aspartate/glutamate racemase family protein [Acidobacteriaceae bacterium]
MIILMNNGNNSTTGSSRARYLGLIGGLGVGATIHYYRELVKAHDARGSTPQLLIAHADMLRVLEHVRTGDSAGLARYLAEIVGRLHAGGAQLAAISAVTPHFCVSELCAMSPLPLVNLLGSLSEEIDARGIRRAALFGTRFTIETSLFGQLKGVQLVMPRPDEITLIHNTYLEVAQSGVGSDEHKSTLTALAHELRERDGVDAIILAGTDLALLFNAANTDFPHVECSRVHINAIMNALFENTDCA